jgi:hypothetical protein
MKTKRRTINRKKQRKLKKYRPTISKSTAQRIHAKRKFMKRVGIQLTPELRRELSTKILTRKAELVQKQSNRISIYDVKHTVKGKSETFRLVFDRMRKNIVTILNNLDKHPCNMKETQIERDNI